MSLPRLLFIAAALAVGTPGLQARSTDEAWLNQYYENPRPQDFLSAVARLDESGYFEHQPTATSIGFFTDVFARNHEKVNTWLSHTAHLSDTTRRILAAAAWQAGHPQGARELRELAAHSSPQVRSQITQLLKREPVAVTETPVASVSSMNLRWGAFLASGDERHVTSILTALGSGEPSLTTAARYTLAQNAAKHDRVLRICQAEMEKQPEAIRAEIRAALNSPVPANGS